MTLWSCEQFYPWQNNLMVITLRFFPRPASNRRMSFTNRKNTTEIGTVLDKPSLLSAVCHTAALLSVLMGSDHTRRCCTHDTVASCPAGAAGAAVSSNER